MNNGRVPRAHQWTVALLFIFMLFPGGARSAEEPTPESVPAIILKVEGDGLAQVRKRSGVMESAGARGKVFGGDRVITDGRSAVHLLLNDGTVIKVGFNSEFKLDHVDYHEKYLAWFFELAHGSIRALVEKLPVQDVRFQVDTPTGTVGVRGTEFVLVYEKVTSKTALFMVEGVVLYGTPGCFKSKSCSEVNGGETSTISRGEKKPTPPKKFAVKELFSAAKEGEKQEPGADLDAILSLFKDARRVSNRYSQEMDEKSLEKLYRDAVNELSAAQDRAIGRTKSQRDSKIKAVKDGTYEDILEAGDAFAEARGLFKRDSNGGAENLLAQTAAAKFRLGEAVKKGDASGLFSDKPKDKSQQWNGRTFTGKKDLNYSQEGVAKVDREALNQAVDDYKAMLEFVEALSKDPQFVGTDAREVAMKTGCRTKSCVIAALNHESSVSSEGVVNAYQNKSTTVVISGRSIKGQSPVITTQYFSRPVPGNGCFKTEKVCKKKLCTLKVKGGVCEPGTYQEICNTTQVPVKCSGGAD